MRSKQFIFTIPQSSLIAFPVRNADVEVANGGGLAPGPSCAAPTGTTTATHCGVGSVGSVPWEESGCAGCMATADGAAGGAPLPGCASPPALHPRPSPRCCSPFLCSAGLPCFSRPEQQQHVYFLCVIRSEHAVCVSRVLTIPQVLDG